MRRRRANPEEAIQRAICQHLRARCAPGVVWWHTPNSSKLGGRRTRDGVPFEALRGKALGVRAGVSDLVFLRDGRFFALELKAENGRPTESQMKFASDVNAAGGFACIVHGLDPALRVLESWGLVVGAAT